MAVLLVSEIIEFFSIGFDRHKDTSGFQFTLQSLTRSQATIFLENVRSAFEFETRMQATLASSKGKRVSTSWRVLLKANDALGQTSQTPGWATISHLNVLLTIKCLRHLWRDDAAPWGDWASLHEQLPPRETIRERAEGHLCKSHKLQSIADYLIKNTIRGLSLPEPQISLLNASNLKTELMCCSEIWDSDNKFRRPFWAHRYHQQRRCLENCQCQRDLVRRKPLFFRKISLRAISARRIERRRKIIGNIHS